MEIWLVVLFLVKGLFVCLGVVFGIVYIEVDEVLDVVDWGELVILV